MPEATLTSTAGTPYVLRERTTGKVVLLYFGYTHCPDVCPVTMANIAQALAKVAPDVRQAVTVIMVTTDPRRDTPDVLRTWLDRFDRDFVGLTGDSVAIASLAQSLRLGTPIVEKNDADTGYTVAHSATVLGYSRDGLAHIAYPFGLRQQDWVHNLQQLAAP
jgi:protein SCO1/2